MTAPPNNPTDAASIPPEIRHRVLMAAMAAVEAVLDDTGHYLDLFGRLELIDLCLDEAEARFAAELPALREN